jgi:hypothetical protein
MLYDMRNLKSSSEPTATLDFPPGAAFVKIHPMDPSKLVAVSAQGLVRTLDMYGRETGAGNGYDAAGTDSEVSRLLLSKERTPLTSKSAISFRSTRMPPLALYLSKGII